ncbi:MAG: kynureninase [Ignavibacteria bacterium]|nr:kynureninase [Ignavibacteria bacterium]
MHWKAQAAAMDASDALASFREKFYFPKHGDGSALYFCGNSLGLQPKTVEIYVQEELDDWRDYGVEGHFLSRRPWYDYHQWFAEPLAEIVGAKPHEVVPMNTLTVNLHLMLASFYMPTPERHKILIVSKEFPSDRYAVETHLRFRGYDPDEAMVEVGPSSGEFASTDDVLNTIRELGSSLAMVIISGVHFYNGSRADMETITRAAHEVGALAGYDLAHAIGNIELKLHDWDVDFAVWCTYKYLNSGPGSVGGVFVHEQYAQTSTLNRLAGWWGNEESTRFELAQKFRPTFGTAGWQLSNAQVLPLAAMRASLEVFMEAGMERIFHKRDNLTGFLEQVVLEVIGKHEWISIITPPEKHQRGAQLSIRFTRNGKEIYNDLLGLGCIVDWRSPDVIRVSPAPLYNSFTDVAEFGCLFSDVLTKYQ